MHIFSPIRMCFVLTLLIITLTTVLINHVATHAAPVRTAVVFIPAHGERKAVTLAVTWPTPIINKSRLLSGMDWRIANQIIHKRS
jgi:hypothetical protein